MPKLRRFAPLILLLTAASCSGRIPGVVWDPQFDFAGLRTYDWAPKEPETGVDVAYDAVDRAVKRAVEAHLAQAGYSRSGDNPSFLITYWVGSEEVAQITDTTYYGPGWGAYWGYGWYGPDGVNISQYEPGSITIDVISSDPAVGLIWRGIASADLEAQRSPRDLEGAAEDAVRKIFQNFPPKVTD